MLFEILHQLEIEMTPVKRIPEPKEIFDSYRLYWSIFKDVIVMVIQLNFKLLISVGHFWGQIGWVEGSHWSTFSSLILIFILLEANLTQSKIKYKFCNICNINTKKTLTRVLMSSFSTAHIKQSVRRRPNVNLRQ